MIEDTFEFQMKNDAIRQLTSTKVIDEIIVKVGNLRRLELKYLFLLD